MSTRKSINNDKDNKLRLLNDTTPPPTIFGFGKKVKINFPFAI